MKKRNLLLIALLATHLSFLVSLRFTAWPEMFSFPYLINNGYRIYGDFHHAYQPLLTLILSVVYKLFGYELIVLKVFAWTLILVSDIFIFLISLKLFGKKLISLLPLGIFVFLQPVFEGNTLWFDLALLPFLLISMYSVILWSENKKWTYLFMAGLFLSACLLVKQQSVLLIPAFLLYFKAKKINLKEILIFFVGGVIPVILVTGWLTSIGVYKDYLFWTFLFPLKFLPKMPGYAQLPTPKQWISLLFLMAPLFIAVIGKLKKDRRDIIKFFTLVFLASSIAAFPRFSYLHLQPVLGSYVILLGLFFTTRRVNALSFMGPVILVGFIFWLKVFPQSSLPTRFYEQRMINLSQFIKNETNTTDLIYLLGPHSLHYVLSNRLPPKPWIENYVWHFEIEGMQEETIEGWEQNMPAAILWSDPEPGAWYKPGAYQPEKITKWIKGNYTLVKEAENNTFLWEKNK